MAIRKHTPPAEPLNTTYEPTEKRLSGLAKALDRRYPGAMTNRCVLQSNCCRPNRFQTVIFAGERSDLAFIPAEAFAGKRYIDQYGDTWSAHPRGKGLWDVIWHSSLDVPDIPAYTRKWPQIGLAAQVNQMLRVIAKQPRTVRT
ncbi:MAG: hypothetical protein JWP44_4896, partial [Mucilaginibacter sp.]|nr:hypothetical protein [Mucilaginibacter sp.]